MVYGNGIAQVESEEQAKKLEKQRLPKDWRCGLVIVLIWVVSAVWFGKVCYNIYAGTTWYSLV